MRRDYLAAPVLLHLCRAPGCIVSPLDFLSVGCTGFRCAAGHYVSRRDYLSSGLHRLYYAYARHPDASSRCSTSCRSVALALAVRPVTASRSAPALLRLCRASGCTVSPLDFSSVGRTGSRRVPGHSVVRHDYLSRGRNGYTLPAPRDHVPRHVAQLVVDYFAYAARPGASARHVARHMARRQLLHLAQARRRLLRLRRASGCLDTSRGSSRGSSSTTSCVATSSCGHTCSTLATSCVATTCLAATLALLRVHRAPPRHRLLVASRRPFISTSFPN
jgi:hypothetical protein